jgi:hypothetical protein
MGDYKATSLSVELVNKPCSVTDRMGEVVEEVRSDGYLPNV